MQGCGFHCWKNEILYMTSYVSPFIFYFQFAYRINWQLRMEIRKIFSQSLSFHCPNFLATNCAQGKIENEDDVIDTVLYI